MADTRTNGSAGAMPSHDAMSLPTKAIIRAIGAISSVSALNALMGAPNLLYRR